MQDIKAKQARRFIGTECTGEEICCCCGERRAGKPVSKLLKPSFTQIDLLRMSPSRYLCESCKGIYDNSDMRFKPIFSNTEMSYEVIARERVLERCFRSVQVLKENMECEMKYCRYCVIRLQERLNLFDDRKTMLFGLLQIIESEENKVNEQDGAPEIGGDHDKI